MVAKEVEEVEEAAFKEEDLTVEIDHNANFVANLDILYGSVTTDLINPFRIQITQLLLSNLLHLLLSIFQVPYMRVLYQEPILQHQPL